MNTGRTRQQWTADAAAILILVLPAFFGWFVVRDQQISAKPGKAIAVITEKRFFEGDSESPDSYHLGYRFRAASGEEFRSGAGIGKRLYDKVQVGDGIEIQYAADDPSNNRVPGEFNPVILEVLGLAVMGLIFFWYLGPRRWMCTLRGEPEPALT
jgi:uncharacterized integral membrane protein